MAKQSDTHARRLLDKLGAAAKSKYVLTCMVKAGDDDQYIMVAPVGDCAKWTQLRAEFVEDIEFVRSIHCGDHTHSLVQLFMKAPTSPEAEAFATVAMLQQTPPRTPPPIAQQSVLAHVASHPSMRSIATEAYVPPGASPCYWDYGLRRWVC